jgi:hypothetical protein
MGVQIANTVHTEFCFRINLTGNDNTSVEWVCADAEKLPFEDNFFTAYTIAFGIRNVTHIDKVGGNENIGFF